MNAPAQIDEKAKRHARAARAAEYTRDWAENATTTMEPYWRARMLDALAWCVESDLSDEIGVCLREVGMDTDGYYIDDDAGFPLVEGGRGFIPSGDVFGRAA